MTEIKKIDGSNCVSFDNALHAEFQLRMLTLAQTLPLEQTHLTQALVDEWKRNIDLEIDINRQTLASADTTALAQLDTQRDATLSYIFALIDAARLAPIANLRSAYTAIEPVIRPYRGLQSEAVDRETLHIRGLLADLDKPDNKNHAATLGLRDALNQLTEQNDAYDTLRQQRAQTRVDTTLESSKTVRPRTDQCYQQACDLIYASQLLATVAADRTALAALIDTLNQSIAEFKTAYNQSMAQKKKAEAKKKQKQQQE